MMKVLLGQMQFTVVASPTGKMCAVVDGGGYFDAKENTWHYLAQCLDLHESWGLCEFQQSKPH